MEIEIRARANPYTVTEVLRELGATRKGDSHEHDEYFKFSKDTVRRLVVRIRTRGERTFLTFKGSSKLPEDIAWQEWETQISDSDALKKLLLSNGLVPVVTIDKRRTTYLYEAFTVNIDHIEGLGDFVEVEAIVDDAQQGRDAVAGFLEKRLGVAKANFITKGYVPLMLERQAY